MKFKPVFLLITIILFSISLKAQTTYFIKYKSSVPVTSIANRISEKKISATFANRQINLPDFKMNYFAKGLGKEEDVLERIIKIQFTENVDAANFRSILSNDPDIEYIQQANNYQIDFTPNDSLLSQQWALEKIKAFDAWEITQGADTVLLAIIDTGIDYDHPDLKNKIFINSGETGIDQFGNDKRTNGIDDDGNGFIDDYMGWDFTDRSGFPFDSTGGDYLEWDNDPSDEHGHGTYISGIAAAETNNFTGIAGVAPLIKVLNLRAFDPGGYGEEDDVAAAILYAVQMGAKVINMSFGDNSFSYVLRDVIRYAYSQGVVLVASSGNTGSNLPHYPSGYSEVISVGNSTREDYVAGSSNYGSTIDLIAPGSSILTTSRNNSYAEISGTSASAPFVSAAASLILSRSSFTNEEVKQIIKSTTDDIGEPGWDLKSGAGRLNLFKALSVTAPSAIKFHSPTQDFVTSGNNIPINISVLSPYFTSFSLDIGTGYNSNSWTNLISNQQYQISNEEILNLDVSGFADTVYTLRLVVNQTTGRTLEERVNFYIDRSAPVAELISIIPAFYGDKTTILTSVYTDDPSVVRMYYRLYGTTDYNFVTLDGFTINNQFVKSYHYGFIPKDLINQNSLYEIYLEAENLVGLKSILKNNNTDFIVSTTLESELSTDFEQPYTLPPGSIFEDQISLNNNSKDIILRANTSPKVSSIYTFDNNEFVLIDSLNERIVKAAGDFNNNGLTDLLNYFVRDGFIDEQNSSNSYSFSEKYSNVGGKFWPILAQDVDNDGIIEIFSVSNDTTIEVWEVNSSLNLNKVAALTNFSPMGFGFNIINSPNAVITDIDGDGTKEFWMIDQDGDIFGYKITGNNKFEKGYVIQTGFLGSSAHLSAGDFNGDGRQELAVLLHSIDEIDISPFYRLVVFNISGNQVNFLLDQALLDASTEFNNTFRRSENSIRLKDLDNDGSDELILFVFPYSYIFKYEFNSAKVISYRENINSNSIFIGDLNDNGVPEVAFPTETGIQFFEFAFSNQAAKPSGLNGFSISGSVIRLKWSGLAERFYVYRGLTPDNLTLVDSLIFEPGYIDNSVELNKNYYYGVRSYDPTKMIPLSGMSNIIAVYSHTPAIPVDAVSNSSRSVIVTFSEKMKNTIDNLQSFYVIGFGYPN
ncbi:MAG: S8 family serine peptidase, partial [Ignavibacteriaceae bacterium]|nr:S8 family serine peptidase [Ignavibacteriaceae bacterium]